MNRHPRSFWQNFSLYLSRTLSTCFYSLRNLHYKKYFGTIWSVLRPFYTFLPAPHFFQHSEKKITIKRRPNSLLQRRFHDGLNIRFHGVPPFSRRKKAYKKSVMGLHDAFSAQEKPLVLPNVALLCLVGYVIERLLLMTVCGFFRRAAVIPAGMTAVSNSLLALH